MNIAVDAMGGDYAPKAVVEGAILALESFKDSSSITLIGDSDAIKNELELNSYSNSRLHVIHSSEVIDMHDHPAKAFTSKPDSSLVKGFQMLATKQADAFCSAGNTGAMMVGSLFVCKALEGILRPPIAGFFPLKNGGYSLMLDIGANADCKPEVLVQFARLGRIYAEFSLGIKNPKVALLSIGEEEQKGSSVVIAAHQMLKEQKNMHFIGNVEGRDLLEGKADVVVTEGFTGNVIFKMGESFYDYAHSMGIDDPLINRMNYEVVGGSPIIGVNGNVIVAHGISSPLAIKNMIDLAHTQVESNVLEKLKEAFQNN